MKKLMSIFGILVCYFAMSPSYAHHHFGKNNSTNLRGHQHKSAVYFELRFRAFRFAKKHLKLRRRSAKRFSKLIYKKSVIYQKNLLKAYKKVYFLAMSPSGLSLPKSQAKHFANKAIFNFYYKGKLQKRHPFYSDFMFGSHRSKGFGSFHSGIFYSYHQAKKMPLQVKVLKLRNKHLTSVPDLSMFPNLKEVDLSQNYIRWVSKNTFASNPLLKKIKLDNNRIRFISCQAFFQNKKLKELDLSNNRLRRLYKVSFSGLRKLRKLNLRNNARLILL